MEANSVNNSNGALIPSVQTANLAQGSLAHIQSPDRRKEEQKQIP